MIRPFPLIAACTLAGLLSGCAGLGTLNQASKPNDLYALTPKSTFNQNLPRIHSQIVVEEPTATAAVNTNQIAVFPTPLEVQYLPVARWVDRAPLIVQALMIESFENSGKVPAVGRSTVGLRADYLVVTDIREFQAHVSETVSETGTKTETLTITVRLNIKIVDEYEDHIIASDSFEKVRIATSSDAYDVVYAFDEALGSAMRAAVEWSISRIHNHGG